MNLSPRYDCVYERCRQGDDMYFRLTARCSGRVSWGKVVRKWVLRLASFSRRNLGREQGGSSNWVQD